MRGRGKGAFWVFGSMHGDLIARLHPTVKYFAVGKTAKSEDRKVSVLFSVEIVREKAPPPSTIAALCT